MSKIRVLHVALNLDEGGLERLVADLLKRLDPHRFDLHLLALEYLGRQAQGLERCAQLHVAGDMPRWSILWPAGLIRQIRDISPDIVHTHSGVWFKASLAARRAGVKFLVHTDHGRNSPDPWHDRLTDGLASRRTDVVIAVSDPLAKRLKESVVHDPERIRVILNGVDTKRFRPGLKGGRLRHELGLPEGTPILGSIGRLDPVKGYDDMIRAFVRLRSEWTGDLAPVLVIAGDGPQRARLAELGRSHALGGSLRFLGWREDVADLLQGFTLFTMASRSEGTSVSLLEAMSSGLCPVVTDVGGNAAVLGDELRHRLCRPNDPSAMTAAWAAALSDPARLRADSAAARQRVEQRFSLEAMVRAHAGLYEGLAHGEGVPGV